jgi:hypothetical protein
MTEERQPASFDAINKVMAEVFRPLLESQWDMLMHNRPVFVPTPGHVPSPPREPLTVGKLIEFFKNYDPATVVGYNDYDAGRTEAYDIDYSENRKMIVIE